jgi:hypothetical protein
MPKTLKSFDFKAFGAGSGRQYDWDKFLDGKIYVLTKGEDFDCEVNTINTMVRKQAQNRYKKVQVSVDKDAGTVTLKATDMTDAERKALDEKKAAKAAAAESEGGDEE